MDTDDVWNGLFGGDFGSAIKKMEKMFSDLENFQGENVRSYGYTMYRDPEGNSHVREFGNSSGGRIPSYEIGEPLTDVTLEDDVVRVVVEIPGVSKENIVLEGTKSTLSVNVNTEHRKFNKTMSLPCDVDPDSAKAEYNNGILEVTLTPMVPPDPTKRINIS